jgi:hypothetical protein
MPVLDQAQGEHWTAYNADCVELVSALPPDSVHFSVYSPPFAHLFIYSSSERDMGNVKDEAEFKHLYRHLVREMYRATLTALTIAQRTARRLRCAHDPRPAHHKAACRTLGRVAAQCAAPDQNRRA